MQDIFVHAYRTNLWGDPESVSGIGSGVVRTAAFRDEIPALLDRIGARTLLDAGCGDFNWMKEVSLSQHYIGWDIVPELIAANAKHASEKRSFVHGDITSDALPRVDVILCRDCLVHFSFAEAWRALQNFKRSGSLYLLTTTFIAHSDNVDIRCGDWRTLDFEAPPFNFAPPVHAIDERCLHTGGIYRDKRLALWRIADIPD
ncbi:class I SAM-dependent methyltransferase [Bradyrhizobium liaoningense]|uniref:class I SAM-dependent methyltransferase n=1 Tax=Bradyrhizobium liaoningense TaxID=43992 RepID=UPI001BA67F66|nr:class I SAM-dependent methyltransferase [Bradyrhizobium liaoningense]MBR0712874.1 class I SAM-dependent methyltransferase [Bradyrhizobium liaoningense]